MDSPNAWFSYRKAKIYERVKRVVQKSRIHIHMNGFNPNLFSDFKRSVHSGEARCPTKFCRVLLESLDISEDSC